MGDTPVSNTGKKLFVTVGTTSFDALIHALDDADTVSLLRRAGFKHVTVQFGRGELGRATGGGLAHLVSGEELTVTLFDFKPSLREDMRSADLVVTHAGAGSAPAPCSATAAEVRVRGRGRRSRHTGGGRPCAVPAHR